MARPNKSSGKRTAFGKRTDAEKSFRTRKKDGPKSRFDEGRSGKPDSDRKKPFGKPSRFSKPGARSRYNAESSDEKPKRFSKPSFRRNDGDEKPFRKSSRPFRGEKPGGFSKSRGRKENDSFEGRPKRTFDKGADGERRSRSRSFGGEKSGGFSKSRGKNEEGPFRPSKKFDARPKRSFDQDNDGDRKSRSGDNYGKPYARKPYTKKKSYTGKTERKEIPFRKDSRFGERSERKFSRTEDVVKHGTEHAPPKTGDELIRLNKFIANSGIGSRRHADELISMGLITVNGEVVTEMGHKVKPTDDVRYEGRKLRPEKSVYVLLNKPKGFITTTDDPQERNTVMNLVSGAGNERIYPVGRLDRNTTGLLLLTNDGELAEKLTHPSYNVKKIYKVELDKPLTKNDFEKIVEGVYLEEGRALVDDLAIVSDDHKEVGIELHIGWNRIVRRIFESLGYEVVKLDRVVYAGLDKKDLNRGQWRFLKPEEIIRLKHFK